jgi:nitronate monooxygenase/enoyl-[acyl-carrier protein] reductase II
VPESWQQRILAARSEDAVKVEFVDEAFPPGDEGSYPAQPRVLRTPFVDEWNTRRHEAPAAAEQLRAELRTAVESGRAHELVPFTGQTAGLVDEVLPAAEIVRRLVDEAEQALRRVV